MTLNPGDPAPDFTLPDQSGDPVSLSSFKGKNVVLYFYPKADTPGCTTQACGVRDHRPDYESADAVVLGVSPDAPKKIAKFDDKYVARLPAAGRRGPLGRGGLWRVGGEVDVRPHVYGQRAHDVRDRPGRH